MFNHFIKCDKKALLSFIPKNENKTNLTNIFFTEPLNVSYKNPEIKIYSGNLAQQNTI